MPASHLLAVQCRETEFLPAFAVEILRRKPALKVQLARRPLAVEHGEPGVIAVAALGNHVLAERAFVDKAVAQRGAPRRRIEGITFPFVAPIAQRLEDVTRQEVLGFSAQRRALQGRRIKHVTDLDHPHFRHDSHQGQIADGTIGRVDDRVGIGIIRRGASFNAWNKLSGGREWPVGPNIRPDLVVSGEDRPQVRGMVSFQLFEAAIAALQRHRAGSRCRRRVVDRQPDGLAGLRMRLRAGHDENFLRSSLKNLFSSGLEMSPAKPSNLPSLAISVATRMKACIATRASEPPTLMRRTPMAAMSSTVKPYAPLLRKFTGFGATDLTTASICSRVLMPGA